LELLPFLNVQRLRPRLEGFLAQVSAALFGQLVAPLKDRGWFAAFPRVLLQDSTVEPLPGHLAGAFPGPANRRQRFAALKLQFGSPLFSVEWG